MRLTLILLFALIVHVDLRSQNGSDDRDEQRSASFNRQKKYSSRKKVLDEDVETDDEQFVDKPQRPIYSAKNKSRSSEAETNRRVPPTTTPAINYLDEASLCINEYDVKSEQLVKVKEFKNGAHMIRIVRIEEPSSSHGLDIKDICMLNCCVEKSCDLAMLSEQATNDGYKCYLFACNDSCTFAPHRDYTSMILKKDLGIESDTPAPPSSNTKGADKHSDASSSTLSNVAETDDNPHTRSFLRESSLILLSLMGLVFTIILLVLVGFYCRDSWKRGRIFKNRSTDADYLINGLYL